MALVAELAMVAELGTELASEKACLAAKAPRIHHLLPPASWPLGRLEHCRPPIENSWHRASLRAPRAARVTRHAQRHLRDPHGHLVRLVRVAKEDLGEDGLDVDGRALDLDGGELAERHLDRVERARAHLAHL